MLRGTRRSTLWRRSVAGSLDAVVLGVRHIGIEHAARAASPEEATGGRGILAAHCWAKRSQTALARGA